MECIFFLPVINKGITILTEYELKLVVISTIGIFAFWRGIQNPKNDVFHLKGGFTVLWLLTFYITGTYIGKYRVVYIGVKKYMFCVICLFIYSFSTFLFYKSFNKELAIIKGYYKSKIIKILNQIITENYDSPIKIIQSISMTLFFLQIKYNKYLSKIISFFGPLTFGIYLMHDNKLIKSKIVSKLFMNEPINLSLNSTIILFLVKGLKIFFICIFIDYLRHLIFALLRIKKFCIFFEKRIIKK